MTAVAVDQRVPVSGWRRLADLLTSPRGAFVVLLVIAFAARCVQFGNPVVQIDDEFYLLTGDRMWQGLLPYVDIWDRKPLGLFLVYAAIRALPGDGVWAYQIVATLFAAATAIVIRQIAARYTDDHGALAAGIVYLLFLGIFGGDAGQAPVFYNLPVALAAASVIRAIERPTFDWHATLWVALATTLMGVAMQIKYTALFEGAYFGLAMVQRMVRAKVPLWRAALDAALWLALALVPTALCWLWYARTGHGDDFFYANFASIFLRGQEGFSIVFGRLLGIIGLLLPLIAAILLAGWPRRREPGGYHADACAVRRFVVGWTIAAWLGLLLFGSYFDHYALPLLVPMSAAAAPVLGRGGATLGLMVRERRYAIPLAAFLIVYGIGVTIAKLDRNRRVRGVGEQVTQMADFIRPRLTNCLYVYDGEPSLYRLTNSCLPTRWIFPTHLNSKREDGAVGVDTLDEVRRIMAARPSVVVNSERPGQKMNWPTWNFVQAVLDRDYVAAREWRVGNNFRVVYLRRPNAGPFVAPPPDAHPAPFTD